MGTPYLVIRTREESYVHLKNVVDPPEPYSSTSISGLNIEHINSTPHLSNITVLNRHCWIGSQLLQIQGEQRNHLPMVDSKESVRLYSYPHFSAVVISFSSSPPVFLLSAQPSKLPLNLSTSDLSSCDGNKWRTSREKKWQWRLTWHWCWVEAARLWRG